MTGPFTAQCGEAMGMLHGMENPPHATGMLSGIAHRTCREMSRSPCIIGLASISSGTYYPYINKNTCILPHIHSFIHILHYIQYIHPYIHTYI